MLAAQCIVWHHLAAYGPMTALMQREWPTLIEHLYYDARLAVQIFLVVAGFLAAQSVNNKPVTQFVSPIFKRYLRLMPIYFLVILLISLAVALTRPYIQADWLPEPVTWGELGAHFFLLHAILNIPALSSGVWYVAIDLQLYVVLIALAYTLQTPSAWMRIGGPRILSVGVALVCAASMLWFNRFESLDNWAIYFFGAYGLGVLAAWYKRSRFDVLLFWCLVAVALLALWIEPRSRLAIAMMTAIWLAIRPKGTQHWTPMKRVLHRLSNSAYAQFLSHFGVIVVFSYMWQVSHFSGASTALGVCLFAWLCSMGLGLFLHEKTELPMHHWFTHHSQKIFRWLTHRNTASAVPTDTPNKQALSYKTH